ncbi:lipid asymmetry maintenance ABC transporter permease subunit MlaE [Neisseria sp. Ec49-e6-T10]|uniref:lipid asymmetry maintenance ABC transporter permease subunit MlaE n=1 Tax=Neisseria sp. Ec49-e6-T10 TaxID=3140744 RepID=UPI003EBD4D46
MNYLLNFFQTIGQKTLNFFALLGRITFFFLSVLRHSPTSFLRTRLTIRQIYFSGVFSIIIIAVSGLFVGLVLALQGYNLLVKFKATDALGVAVALSILRELGPVVAALLFASSAGSAMTSEIGLMKTTEQLDAMSIMGVNPIARVVGPRFWAGVFSMPFLTAIFNVMGIIGSYLIGVLALKLDDGIFWSQMQSSVDWSYDVVNSFIKAFAFGVAISFIAVYQGIHCKPTPEGVLRATTNTVVTSSLVILAVDFILTAFMFMAN